MTGGPGRSAEPHTGARESMRDVIAMVERASGVRLQCSEQGSAVFGASFSAAC